MRLRIVLGTRKVHYQAIDCTNIDNEPMTKKQNRTRPWHIKNKAKLPHLSSFGGGFLSKRRYIKCSQFCCNLFKRSSTEPTKVTRLKPCIGCDVVGPCACCVTRVLNHVVILLSQQIRRLSQSQFVMREPNITAQFAVNWRKCRAHFDEEQLYDHLQSRQSKTGYKFVTKCGAHTPECTYQQKVLSGYGSSWTLDADHCIAPNGRNKLLWLSLQSTERLQQSRWKVVMCRYNGIWNIVAGYESN